VIAAGREFVGARGIEAEGYAVKFEFRDAGSLERRQS
jgi:hypothetical protein